MAWKECVICGAGFDALRNINTCSGLCQEKRKEIIRRNAARMRAAKKIEKKCFFCESVFLDYERKETFTCGSKECVRKNKNEIQKKSYARRCSRNVKCVICRNLFRKTRHNVNTCSENCRKKRKIYIKKKWNEDNRLNYLEMRKREYRNNWEKRNLSVKLWQNNNQDKVRYIKVKSNLKRQLGTEPPSDLVEEATALGLLNRALREKETE